MAYGRSTRKLTGKFLAKPTDTMVELGRSLNLV